jgi:hypothetical protein
MICQQSIQLIELPDGNWLNACRILMIEPTTVDGRPGICLHLDTGGKHYLRPGDFARRRVWIKAILDGIAGGAES